MGEKAERFARTYVNQWACIPASLWRYRCGEYRETEAIALWPKGDPSSAAAATLDLIASMALAREGKTEEARPLLERGRALVGERFRSSLPSGGFTLGNWYDWVFARILLREAESTVPRELSGTGTEMPP
jgi:hypothetical protein